jgi:hypothetical protein
VAVPNAAGVRVSSNTTGFLDRALALALRLDPRRVAIANGAIILLLGIVGVLHIAFDWFGAFDLDDERNLPSTYSAALWTCMAALAVLLGRAEQGRAARMWFALSVPLLFVGADEFGEIHERLERITGIDWQVLYSPLGLVAVVLWVLVGRRLRTIGAGFGLFVAGTICGVASQFLEAVEYGENDQRVAAFNEIVVTEELLEMCGAVLVGLALLAALRMVCRDARA